VKIPRSIAGFVAGICVFPALSARSLPEAASAASERSDSLRARVLALSVALTDSGRVGLRLAPDLAAQVQALEEAYAGRDSLLGRHTPRGVPVQGAVLTSPMSKARFHPILRVVRPHPGVDLAAPLGTPVMATADGVVSYTFRNPSYGLGLDIDHGGGTFTRYTHLSAVDVRGGERVVRGQIIGKVGQTGRATGPHLHYETYIGFTRVDPLQTFGSGFRVSAAPGGPSDL
jgi:murein DD-endopeptidase MepM/ murein hydrolase activator NlpD